MTVLLTSFKRYHENKSPKRIPGYSIAVTQPDWFDQLDTLHLFDIRDPNNEGQWVRPRDFVAETGFADPEGLKAYHDHLLDMYGRRWNYEQSIGQLGTGIAQLIPAFNSNVALCCWCPYTKAAKAQLEDYGSFVCHSWAVATFFTRLGVKVILDKDRERMHGAEVSVTKAHSKKRR